MKENDRVIFYFSGHGDVEKRTIHQNGFLLAHDAPAAAYMTMGTISIKFLQDYLETYIAANKAKEVVLIVDACRSGKLAGGLQGIQVTMQALGQNWNNRIIKILSAQEGELSLEDEKWGGGRGVFSYYLMKGIQGLANRNADSVITTGELASYLPLVVADETNAVQNPKIEGGPKHVLFSFTDKQLAKAKLEIKSGDAGTMAMKGTLEELDPGVKQHYEKYKQHLSNGRLIRGQSVGDTMNCAMNYFRLLLADERAKSIWPSLKSSFLAGLQKKTQDRLDRYIKGKDYKLELKDAEASQEITVASNIIDSTNILYNYILARSYFMQSLFMDDKPAIRMLYKSLQAERDAPYVYNRLGLRYSNVKLNDSAVYFYNKSIALSPKWSYPYNNLALLYWETKDFDRAIYMCNKAIGIDSLNPSPYNILGNVFYDQKKYQESIDAYLKSISIDPEYAHPHNGLGNAYSDIGSTQEAIKSYRTAMLLDPLDELPYNGLGLVFESQMKLDTAAFYYRKALSIKPDLHYANGNLGDVFFKWYNYDSAAYYYRKALKIDSTFLIAINGMADIYYSNYNYDSARYFYEKSYRLEPRSSWVLMRLGNIYADQLHDYETSTDYYNLSLKQAPNQSFIYLRIAENASLSKNELFAMASLERAITEGGISYQKILEAENLSFTKSLKEFPVLMKKYFEEDMR